MAGGLRAVLAVLAAAAGARIDDRAEVDVLAAEMRLQAAGAGAQFVKVGVKEVREVVAPLDAVAGDDLVDKLVDGEFTKIHDGNASFQ